MASYAFLSPWSKGFTNDKLHDFMQGYKRISKAKAQKEYGVSQDLSRGWYQTGNSTWGPNPKTPAKKLITLATGRQVYVVDNRSGEVGLGFEKADGQKLNNDKDVAEYIDSANFKYVKEMKEGHIAKIEYAPWRTLLRVTFQEQTQIIKGRSKTWGRNDVYVFFRVPTTVFGELYWLADDSRHGAPAKNGAVRHLLGIRFWDLVRIRGTRNMCRYLYERTEAGTYNAHPRATREDVFTEEATKYDATEKALDRAYQEQQKQKVMQQSASEKAANKSEIKVGHDTSLDQRLIDEVYGSKHIAEEELRRYYKNFLKKTDDASLTEMYKALLKEGIYDDFFE